MSKEWSQYRSHSRTIPTARSAISPTKTLTIMCRARVISREQRTRLSLQTLMISLASSTIRNLGSATGHQNHWGARIVAISLCSTTRLPRKERSKKSTRDLTTWHQGRCTWVAKEERAGASVHQEYRVASKARSASKTEQATSHLLPNLSRELKLHRKTCSSNNHPIREVKVPSSLPRDRGHYWSLLKSTAGTKGRWTSCTRSRGATSTNKR